MGNAQDVDFDYLQDFKSRKEISKIDVKGSNKACRRDPFNIEPDSANLKWVTRKM